MPSAEIIAIGTELLLGETLDTNSRTIAVALRDVGIDLYWTSTVGDNETRIAEAIRLGLERSDVILTTGGLGPTVDDATRQGVARAVGEETEYRPDLWDQILERYRSFGREPTENNRRQAFIPRYAIPVTNPVGTAPAFIVELENQTVICLPGVPPEMEFLLENEILPYLKSRYNLQESIVVRLLHTAGAGESQIDDRIGDLEQMTNPTVGLAAHTGQVDVRITAKAATHEEARKLIEPVEARIRERLWDWIYGADQDTLEGVALKNLQLREWKLVVVEAGLGGELISKFAQFPEIFLRADTLSARLNSDALNDAIERMRRDHGAQVGLGVSLIPGQGKQEIHLGLVTPLGQRMVDRSYGGAPVNAPKWAVNLSLDLLRRNI